MSSEPTPASKNQDSARAGRGLGSPDYLGPEPKLQPKVKTVQICHENDIQEPCREIFRRPKFQAPESHSSQAYLHCLEFCWQPWVKSPFHINLA